jgi:hypothetical protein
VELSKAGNEDPVAADNVVPFARVPRRRTVTVPEREWHEVLEAVRRFNAISVGCPIARRIAEEES